MKPIRIQIMGHTQKSPAEICSEILNTESWSDFKGYTMLPGIRSASFENRTPAVVGSRINVQNTDGSAHVEEIVEWDVEHAVSLKFQEFSAPLNQLATHFIETWSFNSSAHGTEVTRAMTMYPKSWLGWFILLPISQFMKKAFAQNLVQFNSAERVSA